MTSHSRPPVLPRVLHLEDDPVDAELIHATLAREWPDCRIEWVQTRDEFLAALQRKELNLVLSDFSMPGFDGLSALTLVRQHRPDLPFIFLSGTIGEDYAVEALKHGATDYVLKDRMGRLITTIRRALDEAQEHRRRRAAEQRLREQAELLDKAKDAIFVRDLGDRVLYWNRSAERIFGYTASETLGRRITELMWKGVDPAPLHQAGRILLEKGEWAGEFRLLNKAGEERDIMASWTLVRDRRGAPKTVLCIDTDVTEQKQLEKQYLRAQRLESLGILAGGIAHDLNNVLAPILMSVELLQQKATDPDARRMLEVLATSAQHGADLVRQVLAFARGTEGGRVEFQLRLIIRDVARLLGETVPRSINIEMEAPADLWFVLGDSTQLNQVLMNLCVNACDAMPNGGKLLLRAENATVDDAMARANPGAQPGPHVLVTVADTGTGIPPEILDRIFDPFFTTKEAGKGTGLGLATVLGIVKSHGGFLRVDSRVGRGATFQVYLPAVIAASVQEPPIDSMPPFGRGEIVLVIDDEESVRVIAGALLENHGYRAILAADGAAGLEAYRGHAGEISAVLTDMMMPGMQGNEVIAGLRAINPAVRIVAMSGLLEVEKLGVIPEPGQLELLQKPMTGEKLLRVLNGILAAPALC